MKKALKIIVAVLVVAVVGVVSYVVGYHIGKDNKDKKDDSVYMAYENVEKVINSAYSAVNEAFNPLAGSMVSDSNTNQSPVNDLKIAQKKDGLIVNKPQTNDDVLVEVDGAVVPTEESYSLNLKNALSGSLKYIQALVANDVSGCADNAITYQIRDAATVPANYDLKILLTGYLDSIRLNMMLSDTERIIDNSIIVLTYNSAYEVTDCIYANKDVYAIYNAEADKSYYLDTSKEGATAIRTELDKVLTDFQNANSLIDLSVDMKSLLS